jgi:chorismate mutase
MKPDHESGVQILLERRREIDALDTELLRLINQRAEIASRLTELKRILGRGTYDAHRERQIINRICEDNDGPLDRDGVINIFGSIISECRRVQEISCELRGVAGEIK